MKCKVVFMLIILSVVESAFAGSPNVVNFQGRLTTAAGTPVSNSIYSVHFALYNVPTGGAAYWGETQSVTTTDGLFSVSLGSVIWFPTWLFGDTAMWLGMRVGSDPELSPRTKLTSVPFAMNSMMGGGWRDEGSRIRLLNPDDSVGIGVFAPTRPLHVSDPSGGLFVFRVESSNNGATVSEISNTSSSSVWESSVAGSAGAFGGWVTAGDMYFYKQGNSIPSIICKPDGHVAVGRPSLYGSLDVGDAFDTIGGYFAVSANTAATHVVHSEYQGVGNFDAVAVYGKCTPADYYGFGGQFEGGFIGVRGRVFQNGSNVYYGSYGHAQGDGTGKKHGVYGKAEGSNGDKYGVYGIADGTSGNKYGVFGYAAGTNYETYGVWGEVNAPSGKGVFAYSTGDGSIGVLAESHGTNSTALMAGGYGTNSNAGFFYGNVQVFGTLSKSAGTFKIDHPLDPENKYLQHSFVESPDMKNVYDGNVILDAQGSAIVSLPDYFEALNRDFRYQLTCVGGYAPVYIAQKIAGNSFRISGGIAGLEVSWQVTGIRKDPYAEAHRIQEVVDKPADERGKYQFPELYDKPESAGIGYEHRKDMESRTALRPNPTRTEQK